MDISVPGVESDPVLNRVSHVSAVWKNMTLLWGGLKYYNDTYWDPAIIHCHEDGISQWCGRWWKKGTQVIHVWYAGGG